ncbi:ell-associated factor Eaf [Amyelois transitella]|uniref:ell-associated factor Eaf n=1 Tax=Amyelois transitella TaxID=680683 RepID=UPI00067BB7D4|nr:ell-associated factor Eaf [Amyelois transitella]
MADNFGCNYGVRELNLGASFTNNKAPKYHTIKYDFKPASVDVNKMATVDVGSNNQVTVTVPHLDGAGVPQTVFKGSQRPYNKECVLIIDKNTGQMTLEKLSSYIQVKKTRQESATKPLPLTPLTADFTNTTQRSTSRTRVTTNRRTNINAGAAGSGQMNQGRFNGNVQKPQNMVRSPTRVKTSPPQAPWSSGGNSTLASLPMIGLDDPAPAPQHNGYRPERAERPERPVQQERQQQERQLPEQRNNVNAPMPAPVTAQGVTSQDDSSSSSSSDSDSNSGSDSDSDDDSAAHAQPALANGGGNPALPSDVLNDDLCLSESGSDSD